MQSLTPRKSELTGLYDLLHIIGVIAVGCALMKIIPHSSFGWSILGASLFLAISTVLYARVDGAILSKWLVVMFGGYFLYHIVRMDTMITNEAFPVLVQLSGLAIAFISASLSRYSSKSGKISFTIASVASVIITSLYVNSLTHNVFAVTIYLTLLSTGLILYGINTPKPPYRTAGLYIGTAVLLKILFYDLWIGVDNLIIRVVALMVSGGVMIGLSQLYGRSVSRGWAEEFSPLNFRSE